MKRFLPGLLIAAGFLLALSGVGYARLARQIANPGEATLPASLADLSLAQATTGWPATVEIARLHRQEFPLTSGALGVYGEGRQVTLWVAGAPLELLAERMLAEMRARIAEGESPFTPAGERRDGERPVYELDGLGQKHFYFRSGDRLIWLAADPALAEEALRQALAFYP